MSHRNGISLQAMDSSHVSLVSLLLKADGLSHYRCDSNLSLGINMAAMTRIMKCADQDDLVLLKSEDESDTLTFTFESSSTLVALLNRRGGRAQKSFDRVAANI